MSQRCPQCGAEYPPGETCRDRFDRCLALEYENPTAWGAVHHLTVTCYMLQHNAYSHRAWIEARKMLAQFVHASVTPAAMLAHNRSILGRTHRTWSVTKGEKLLEFDTLIWTRTITGIRLDDPETYCSDVRLWAVSILRDTEHLAQALDI